MSQPIPFVFANLPTELVRDIFERAAVADRATARALSLLSSAVHHWTDPHLYHTVVLSSARTLRAFQQTIAAKPPGFAPACVQHLGIFALGPVQSIDCVLAACTGARSLACGFSLPSFHHLRGAATVQALVTPREQHLLGLACRDGWDTALVAPSVTHLRIHLTSFSPNSPFALDATGDAKGWDRLACLPALTHLAIVYRPAYDAPTAILHPLLALLTRTRASTDAPTQALRVVLVQVLGSSAAARSDPDCAPASADEVVALLNHTTAAMGGPALRIVAERAPISAVRQWEDAVRGGHGVWDGAEAAVGRRSASALCV